MDANLPPDTTSRDSAETEYGEKSPFRAARKEPLLTRTIPVAGQLPGYRAPSARQDLVAGVTVAALALPSAMAYAEVAGLSPVNGLYALLLPTVAYVLLGSSRQLIVGPEGSISTLVAVAVLPLAAAASSVPRLPAALVVVVVAIGLSWALDLETHGVAVVGVSVTHADSTGLEALEQLTKDLRNDGITLVVARLRTRMEESFALAGVTETIGRDRFYPTVRAAVDASVSPTRRP